MSELHLDEFYFDSESYLKKEVSSLDLSGLTGGKHLRSKLIALIGYLHNVPFESITKLGRVVELVHNATLTHDDVVDNSHTRRGKESVPALINNKKSVLLGDYMLAKALHELSDFDRPKLTAELTLTLKDLVEGEWIQFDNTNPYQISTNLYETLAVKKTGSLFRWCFLAPLLLTEDHSGTYSLYQELGEQLGVIFQMSDDVIDFNQESKKTYGLDFKNNNINYALHFAGKNCPKLEKTFLHTETLEDLDEYQRQVIFDAVETAKQSIEKKVKHCHSLLAKIEKNSAHIDKDQFAELYHILDFITARVF